MTDTQIKEIALSLKVFTKIDFFNDSSISIEVENHSKQDKQLEEMLIVEIAQAAQSFLEKCNKSKDL